MGNVIVSSDPIPMISISVEEYKALLQAQRPQKWAFV